MEQEILTPIETLSKPVEILPEPIDPVTYAVTREMTDGETVTAIMTILDGSPISEEVGKLSGEVIDYTLIKDPENELPTKDFDRNAWVLKEGKVSICPDKQLNIIRDIRNYSLGQLDQEELTQSFLPNGDVTDIQARKQALRDLPEKLKGKTIEQSRLIVKETLNRGSKK